MNETLRNRINNDLKESQINLKVVFSFIPIAFFAVFSRFFSIVFGGIDLQDEARIASMSDTDKYLIAATVLTILFLILWRCNRIMKLNMKALGYFIVLGTFAVLIVIGVNELIMIK